MNLFDGCWEFLFYQDTFSFYINKFDLSVMRVSGRFENDEFYCMPDTTFTDSIERESLLHSGYELSVGINDACNMRCTYCYANKRDKHNINLQLLEERMQSLTNFSVQIIGVGEPLLDYDKFCELIEILRKYTKDIWLVTNGTLITTSIANFLVSNKINVTVSIDGDKNTNDLNRRMNDGQSSYDEAVSGINRIYSASQTQNISISIWLSSIVSKKNFNLIENFIALSKLNCDFIMFRLYYGDDTEFLILLDDDIKKKLKEYVDFIFAEIVKGNNAILKIINVRDFVGKYIIRILSNNIVDKRCGAGISKSAYMCDNKEYICDFCFGRNDLEIKNYQHFYSSDCIECHFKKICGGSCQYMCYLGLGTYYCNFERWIIENVIINIIYLQENCSDVYEKLKKNCIKRG